MFHPHQNLSDLVNGNIIRSEIEGGVYLKDLPEEATLEVVTRNRGYKLVVRRDGSAMICGHPRVLSGAGSGAHCGVQLGRVDAEDGVSGTGDAS